MGLLKVSEGFLGVRAVVSLGVSLAALPVIFFFLNLSFLCLILCPYHFSFIIIYVFVLYLFNSDFSRAYYIVGGSGEEKRQ